MLQISHGYLVFSLVTNDDKWQIYIECKLCVSTWHARVTIGPCPNPPSPTSVRLQNLPWYKTGLVSRQVLHLLSKLDNWIWPKTGQYKTCIVSNTKIDYIYMQSILVFDTMQLLYWHVLGQIQFCSFDRRCKTCLDTKPVLYQGRFCSLTDVITFTWAKLHDTIHADKLQAH